MAMSSKGEFGFIDFIKEHFKAPDGVMGIGDDCAILRADRGDGLVSTDLEKERLQLL